MHQEAFHEFQSRPIHFPGPQFGNKSIFVPFLTILGGHSSMRLPFTADGFDRRDGAFHVADPDQRQEHLQRLGFRWH